jgi:murein DD-endopeptidase MepM/ murein hydrolase activator NlpD
VKLLYHPPPQAWVSAARELPLEDRMAYPVEKGRLWRGLGNSKQPGKAKLGGGPRGPRRKPHAGLDIAAPEGTPIRAMQNGIVVYSDNELTGYGNLVIVVHADGTVALYGHCRATYVFAGQYVSKGVVIGEVGTTGYANGAHLHLEYRVKGRPRDPSKLFDQPLKAATNKRR